MAVSHRLEANWHPKGRILHPTLFLAARGELKPHREESGSVISVSNICLVLPWYDSENCFFLVIDKKTCAEGVGESGTENVGG